MSAATDFLRQLIEQEGGSITVERFMREALFHPQFGYYSSNVETVGRRGDFSTSPTLHPAFGKAIARWLRARANRRGGNRWHVIELGAGSGELANVVLASLGWLGRRGLQYHIVEVSAGLRAQQSLRLGDRVRWHSDVAEALTAAGGRALIFSNEFVDAFPCAQFAWDAAASSWREVRVAWSPTWGAEPFVCESAVSGRRIEQHRSYRRWLGSWTHLWQSGRMLTIDYGGHAAEVYDRRPGGTLRAYWHHQRYEGPEVFARFGRQDVTADVNFSDLESWSADAGWRAAPLLTQAEFLRRWLPARVLHSPDPGLEFLLDPDGAGGAFKVLEQWPAGSGGGEADLGVGSPRA